jgi:hypothetical protein
MTIKLRSIEVDEATALTLESRAVERGVSVAEVVAELARGSSQDLSRMQAAGLGPWALDVLAEDGRRLAEFEQDAQGVAADDIDAWLRSWGKPNELAPPKLRKL